MTAQVIMGSTDDHQPTRRVGDRVESEDVGFIIDRPERPDARCYVAEHGVIIWAGDFSDFVDLVRGAAREVPV